MPTQDLIFTLNHSSGWIDDANICRSPNHDERPENTAIDLLVIHNISLPPGQFETGCVEQFFTNSLDHDAHPFFDEIRGVTVSAHFLINRSGALTQFVSTQSRAWHAGQSIFAGRERCNDYSIGVELEGTDDIPYTREQYECLVKLTGVLQASYPAITEQRIVGHSDIAPQRKTDPGDAFDWLYYRRCLREESPMTKA